MMIDMATGKVLGPKVDYTCCEKETASQFYTLCRS